MANPFTHFHGGAWLAPQDFVGWFAGASGVLSVAYFAWGYSQIFARRPFLAAAGASTALIVGAAVWLGVIVANLTLLRR